MKQPWKIHRVWLLFFLVIMGCEEHNEQEAFPKPLHPSPKSVKLNLDPGYALNTLTGDTIRPQILSNGDTLITGKPLPLKGTRINPDSVSVPKVVPAKPPKAITKVSSNSYKIPEDLTVKRFNTEALVKVVFDPKTLDQRNNYLVNYVGDTVLTGVPIRAKGKVVTGSQPLPTKALVPRYKDEARQNVQIIDVNEGMASPYVTSLLEDSRGNLWIGTFSGVSKYNGTSFLHYTEKEGLNQADVRCILEDKKGDLWFGTRGKGICRYDGESFTRFTEKEGLNINSITSILEDKRGNLWFTSEEGISSYDGESFIHYTDKDGVSNSDVRCSLLASDGSLWFGTWGGGITVFDGQTFTQMNQNAGLIDDFILSLSEDSHGNIWIGTYGKGLCKFDGQAFTYFTEKEGLSSDYINFSFEDMDGNLWFGTDDGINKYDGKFFTHLTKREGLDKKVFWSGLADRDGNLWFGAFGGGLNKYRDQTFKHFVPNDDPSNDKVWSILEDSKQNVWLGTDGAGVRKFDGETFVHFTENEGLIDNYTWAMAEDHQGNLWFGSFGNGIGRYNGESFTHYTEAEGLNSNFVTWLLIDRQGNLWIGTLDAGLCMFDGEAFTHYSEKEGFMADVIVALQEDRAGNIWFGGSLTGAGKITGETVTYYSEKEGLCHSDVWSIFEDHAGNLWFSTEGGGVSRFDGKTFTHFSEKEGMGNNNVYSIQEDHQNQLWFGTGLGISKLSVDTSTFSSSSTPSKQSVSIRAFERNDGLKGMDFFSNSVCLDSKNRMWWGGSKGLTVLDLEQHKSNHNIPRVSLSQVDINGHFIDYRNLPDSLVQDMRFSEVQKFENYPLNLELSHDKSHLTFHFSAIEWAAPHKIRYSYIMEGLNTKWSKPVAEGKVDYRNIPPGTYTFKVRAVGASSTWSEASSYLFTIRSPWWSTRWAILGYIIIGALLLYSFMRLRLATLKQRQKELVIEVSKSTQEIRNQKQAIEAQRDEVQQAYKETEEQKSRLEKANKEITASIKYAKRIQDAMLPKLQSIEAEFPESFVLYKPRDIVSGDFYWYGQTVNDKGQKESLIVGADCTGHGVPGAFMSMAGDAYLNLSVLGKGMSEPTELLHYLNSCISDALKQNTSENRDGMDMAICRINKTEKTLEFAGANQPLIYIQDGELHHIKGSKFGIGGLQLPTLKKQFETHKISLDKPTIFYLFSDGYIDQFGGPRNRKFMTKNLKRLLLEIHELDMNEQKERLDQVIQEWMHGDAQIDDILIMGFRIE